MGRRERLVWPLTALAALAWPAGCGGAGPRSAEPAHADPAGEPSGGRAAEPDPDRNGADEEGFAVEGLKGRLEPDDIQAGIEPYGDRLTECYRHQIGGQRYISGAVTLKFLVSREGAVKEVYFEESNLGAWPVEHCMLEVAREIAFARPTGGEAEFTVPLDFSGRGRLDWWEEERAQAEVADKLADLAGCEGQPDGVVITLYVGTRGQVKSAGFAAARPLPDAWATCAAGKLMAWTLTDPRGTVAKLSFRYPTE